MESDLIRSTIELTESVAEPLVKFLHIILNKLVLMMTHPPIVAGHLGKCLLVAARTVKPREGAGGRLPPDRFYREEKNTKLW
jgi:hypothetical protein